MSLNEKPKLLQSHFGNFEQAPERFQRLERRRHPKIRAIVDSPLFNITIVIFIVLSVALMLIEIFGGFSVGTNHLLEAANDFITLVFIAELIMRWLVSPTTIKFFRRYWIDIVAILPLFRVFRLGRAFRLMRVLRFFSLVTFFERRISVFGSIFEGRLLEYMAILSFMLFAVIFGTIGFSQYEVGANSALHSTEDAFWKALFSLLAGEYADYPVSLGGKVVFTSMLLFGMGAFAMLTGTVSAMMMEKLKESAMHHSKNPDDLTGHIIICGYSKKMAVLISEILSEPKLVVKDILIVSIYADVEELRSKGIRTEHITVMKEDFTKMDVLVRAGVNRAKIAIILSESGENRSTQDIDARTILCALTIERLNPDIHTSAELYNPEYADHLTTAGVEDVIIQGDVSGRLLARAAMQEGVLEFFSDILTNKSGNSLAFITPPSELVGVDVAEAVTALHKNMSVLLIGVKPPSKSLIVNPHEGKINKDDLLLIIKAV